MTRLVTISALALLIACNGGDEDVADTGSADTGTDTTDADPDVNNYVPADYPPAAPSTMIVFGDSISTGVGADDGLSYYELLEVNDDTTWPDHGSLDLESAFPSVTTFVNVAEGGATTDDLTTQAQAAEGQLTFPVSGPVIIVGTIAGNDLVDVIFSPSTRQQTVDDIQANISAFVDWTQDTSKFPDGAYLYLANVYDPSDGVGSAEECFFGFDTTEAVVALQDANAGTRAMAETRGFAVVDMHGHFMGHGLNYDDASIESHEAADPSLWFESDCIHPNGRGHHELRRIFFGAIADESVAYEVP